MFFNKLFKRSANAPKPLGANIFRPMIESLEERDVPVTITWNTTVSPSGGDFFTGSNWVGGVVPGPTDDAIINLTAAGTVSLNPVNPYTISSISTNANTSLSVTNSSVTLANSVSTSAIAGPVSITAGSSLAADVNSKVLLLVGSAIQVDGTFRVNSPASFVAQGTTLSKQSVSIQVGAGGVLNLANATISETPGNSASVSSITVNSGATFKSANSTIAWDTVTLDNTSIVNPGEVTATAFNATLLTPTKHIPLLVGNTSFRDVVLTGQTTLANLTLNPLGQDASQQRYVIPAGTFTVNAGTTLTFGPGSKVLHETSSIVSVSGTLGYNSTASVIAQGTTLSKQTVSIQVGTDGVLNLANVTISESPGNSASVSSITVNSGATFKSANSTIAWDTVTLDNTSTVNPGEVTATAFNATLLTPTKHIPLLVGNTSFRDVVLTGQTTLANLTLNPLGQDASQQRYVIPTGTFTVNAGTTLTFGPGSKVLHETSSIVSVSGTLGYNSTASIVAQGTTFTKQTVAIQVGTGGVLNLANATLTESPTNSASVSSITISGGGSINGNSSSFGWDSINLSASSAAKLQYNFFNTDLNINSAANIASNAIRNNDFSGVLVVASGASGTTINLTNNYWGSTVTGVINGMITDKLDNAALPEVNYTPFFDNRPVQTLVVVAPSVTFSLSDQPISLTASLRSPSQNGPINVNGGTVTFTLLDSGGGTVGTPQTANVTAGTASVTYTLPAGTNAGLYTIQAAFSGFSTFAASTDNSQSLTVTPVTTTTTGGTNVTTAYRVASQTVTVSATVNSPVGTVNAGFVTFQLFNGSTEVGSSVFYPVVNGTASGLITIPAGQVTGVYSIRASFNGTTNLGASSTQTTSLTINPAATTTAIRNGATTAYTVAGPTVTLIADVTSLAGTVNAGTVVFTIRNGATVITTSSATAVINGVSTANVVLPSGTDVGTYSVDAAYGDSNNNFATSNAATNTMTVTPAVITLGGINPSAVYNVATQSLSLNATITSTAGTVNAGQVTYTILSGSTVIGTPVTVNVTNGAAPATYQLPAGTGVLVYTLRVEYLGTTNFQASSSTTRTVTILAATSSLAGSNVPTTYTVNTQLISLSTIVTSPAGTVNEGSLTYRILQGATLIGSAVTVSVVNGVAAGDYTLPANLTSGVYTIEASYLGTTNIQTSLINSNTLTINAADTTSVCASATTVYSVASQSVTLSATVASGAGVVNVGTVTFSVLSGTTVLFSSSAITVVNGSASGSITVPAGLAAGAYTIRATYSGTVNFVTSTSSAGILTINSATTSIVANTATSTYRVNSSSVTLSATVTSGAGVVSAGTATFAVYDGATLIGSATTIAVSAGSASVSYALPGGLAVQVYTVQVQFTGTANLQDSTATASTLTLNAASTTVTATATSTAYSLASQAVTLQAQVTSLAGTLNEGSVSFQLYTGTTPVGSSLSVAVVNGTAAGSYTIPAGTTAGTYRIEASFAATTNLLASIDTSRNLTINPTSTTVSGNDRTLSFSSAVQTVSLSSNVSSLAGTVDAGTVTFRILSGGTLVGTALTVNVVGGVATGTYSLPANATAQTYTIESTYNGTANLSTSVNNTATLTIQPVATTISAPNQNLVFATTSQNLSVSATVDAGSNTVNSGTVTFTLLNGNVVVGAAVTVNVTNGQASTQYVVPANTPAGSYTLRVVFNGTTNFITSSNSTATLVIAAASTSLTVSAATTLSFSTASQQQPFSVTLQSTAGVIDDGQISLTLLQGATTISGPIVRLVSSGGVNSSFPIPSGLNAGSYSLQVAFSSSGNWANSSNSATFAINQATQVISFSIPGAVTYGQAPITLSAAGGSSGNPVQFQMISGPAQLNGNQLSFTAVGPVVVQATQTGSANYAAATPISRQITVNPATLTITANNAQGTAGKALPNFTFAVTGLVNNDSPSIVTGVTLSTTATSSSPAGVYPITISGATAPNYTINFVNGSLTLNADPTVPPPPTIPPTPVPPTTVPPATVPSTTVPPTTVPPVSRPIQSLEGSQQLAVGSDAGGAPIVRIYNASGSVVGSYSVFTPTMTNGVRVAAPDFDGNGQADIIAGTGPGISNQIQVLRGGDGSLLASFQPFEASFVGGIFVTVGDVNADGVPDLVVTPDQSGGPIVVVYDGAALAKGNVQQLNRFFGIEDPAFRGGARAAIGLVNGKSQIIVSAGFGGGPRVAVFDGASVSQGAPSPARVIPDFFAFETTLRNGVYVAAGDITGNGSTEMIFGAGPGGGPRVRVMDAGKLASAGGFSNLDEVPSAQVANFFAGDTASRGGVRVTVKNFDTTQQAAIISGAGTASGSRVTAYSGTALLGGVDPTPLFAFDDTPGFTGGVFVG